MTWVQPPAVIQISSVTHSLECVSVCVSGELSAVLAHVQSHATNHNQDTQRYQPPKAPSCYPLVTTPSLLNQESGLQMYYVISQVLQNGIMQYIPFWDWLFFPLSIISLRFIPAGARVDNLFLLIAE